MCAKTLLLGQCCESNSELCKLRSYVVNISVSPSISRLLYYLVQFGFSFVYLVQFFILFSIVWLQPNVEKKLQYVSENRTIFSWPIFLASKKAYSVINFGQNMQACYFVVKFLMYLHVQETDYTTAATLRFHFKLMTCSSIAVNVRVLVLCRVCTRQRLQTRRKKRNSRRRRRNQ